jgi:hypothetical protein
MTVGIDKVVFYLIDIFERLWVELTDEKLPAMPQTTFDPMTIACVIAPTCIKVTLFAFVSTKKAVVRLSPIEWLAVPLMKVNDSRKILCFIIAATMFPSDFHSVRSSLSPNVKVKPPEGSA